jgi:protocatechuate 3,4-dioxygenase beta subunit
MRRSVLWIWLSLAGGGVCSQPASDRVVIGGPCEDCEQMFEGMPPSPGWQIRVSPPGEKGEPMVISGRILKPDGKTPAPGVILYVYHTDASGNYSLSEGQTDALYHGHLRGWMKTDSLGRYEFRTIRPASYPDSDAAQHVHPILFEPGKGYYWIDEYLFEDDPHLTAKVRAAQPLRGGSGIISLRKDAVGVWTGQRDIIMGMNVPGYR